MLERNKNSHKGDNGKVMVIGGNELFHGAPILCALGAEYSGADLIFPWIPSCHAQVARTFSLNFILQTFKKNSFESGRCETAPPFFRTGGCGGARPRARNRA